MPYSYPLFKDEVAEHLRFATRDKVVLDVGPGSGTYGMFLKGHCNKIVGLEIFAPYIEQFNLESIYDQIVIGDIRNHDIHLYDYIILGDVLEHLELEYALPLIDRINALGKKCLVAVPYLYEQGEEFGNIHETHHQPDLTPQKMKSRYPSLKQLCGNEQYGYYTNY